jgi:YjjG family noncanonical pyrimidine nucleotidase
MDLMVQPSSIYSFILFDADGTLYDFEQAQAYALQKTFEQSGHPFHTDYANLYTKINAQLWDEFEQGLIKQDQVVIRRFEQLFAAIHLPLDPQLFNQRYLKHLAEGSRLIDGAEEVVKALSHKVQMLLLTNGVAEVQRPRFERSAIRPYFAGIVISEEVGAAKPDGRIFEAAFQMIGNPKKAEVLIVGDSLNADMRGGNQFGIDTCWFNPHGLPNPQEIKVCYEIRNLSELLVMV